MPINKETIISVFDEKLTLMQWLKTINKALEDAVLTGVEITKKGNATLSFKFTFEDGTFLETNDIVLQQGESVNGAYIQNGHLYLTLTNGNNLDAGNVKPVSNFSIDANQHLIVHYADGTSQDLGAIFSGNVNISGTLTANLIDGVKVTGNEIVEKMNGYSFVKRNDTYDWTPIYVGVVKNGNKLTMVIFGTIKIDALTDNYAHIAYMYIPSSVGAKLYPHQVQGFDILENKKLLYNGDDNLNNFVEGAYLAQKIGDYAINFQIRGLNNLTLGSTYYFRIEETFLLSDNLAQ